jgi:PAS domain S-box-containing protein
MFDHDMRYLAASARWRDDYHLGPDVIGRSHYEVFPEISANWKNVHRRALGGEILRAERDPFPRLDGSLQWLRWEVRPWHRTERDVGGIVIFSEDITENVEVYEALRESEERFRLVANITNDVIFDGDLKSGKVWWSEGLSSTFGHDPDSFATGFGGWIERIADADRPRVSEAVHDLVEGDGCKWSDEYRVVRADGAVATVVDRRVIVRDPQGKAVRMLGSIVDVTERRELDERLRQSQKLEAVGQLTGGIAHDFNNLLTVILGNTEMLAENLTHDHQSRLLAEMTGTAAERGAELTRRLLAFARRQPLDPKVVEINKLVTGMDGLLRRTLTENVEIASVLGADLWAARIDPGQLEAAVLNLALNAQDAMPEGGRLTMETANAALDAADADEHDDVTPGQYVMLAISDTGVGMDSETRRRAFEPFFTTKPVGKGSGLGLSMVYGFIKQSKGHVKIRSEPGHGTAIELYLPRAA